MKQRIITALVLLIICIPLFIIGGIPFKVLISIIGVLGLYEFLKLREIPLIMKILSYILLLSLILTNAEIFFIDFRIISIIVFLLLTPIIFYKNTKYNINDASYLIMCVLVLGIAFKYFIAIRFMGLNYLIFLFLITIFTDTFAYVTGMLIGKHKMCPSISPNKTWEGFFGGLVMGTFIATSFYYTALYTNTNFIVLTLLVALLSVIGQMGDLVFSAIKRYYNIKDYSNLLPGHGGVLDRVDSILFVVLAFSIIYSLII